MLEARSSAEHLLEVIFLLWEESQRVEKRLGACRGLRDGLRAGGLISTRRPFRGLAGLKDAGLTMQR